MNTFRFILRTTNKQQNRFTYARAHAHTHTSMRDCVRCVATDHEKSIFMLDWNALLPEMNRACVAEHGMVALNMCLPTERQLIFTPSRHAQRGVNRLFVNKCNHHHHRRHHCNDHKAGVGHRFVLFLVRRSRPTSERERWARTVGRCATC